MPAFACSCRFDDRTLEERIDDADRVLRVRVVGADLVGELPQPDASRYDRFRSERISYRLRSVETVKGARAAPPKLLGQAGEGSGDCTIWLPIGAEILLFVERGEVDIHFNYCSQPYVAVEPVPEIDLRLQAVREFVAERTPIHACDNLVSVPSELRPECKNRRSAAIEEWRAKDRPARAD